MGEAVFLLALAAVSLVSLARPWIGVVCAYVIVVLEPQAVWFWDFANIRPAFWVLAPTCIGVAVGLVRGQFDLSILRSKRNFFILVLWICFAASYYFGPYTDAGGPYRFDDPDWALSTIDKIMLLYFMACLCIDSELKLKTLFYVVAGSAAYLIYWGNDQYFSGHLMGRLAGPVDVDGHGVYQDENVFAMLFVVAQPFLWYLGASRSEAIWRYGCWLIIPFSWHAVFLTASRGGLIGLAVTTLLIALRSKNRFLGLALIPAFIVAYQWQAGDLMKSRAQTIGEYQTEESAETRLEAWQAASAMIADHPLTGVGLASFGPAFPHYSDKHPREAHNTFFQITAESGVLAGAMYVFVVVSCIGMLWANAREMRKRKVDIRKDAVYAINEAVLVAFCGLVVCSLFLSLQLFEIFYCLNVLANAVGFAVRRRCGSGAQSEGAPARRTAGELARAAASPRSAPMAE